MTTVNNTVLSVVPTKWASSSASSARTADAASRQSHSEHQVEQPDSAASQTSPVMARPLSVVATDEIVPVSASPDWDITLQQALKDMPDPDSWALLGRGPGMLSGTETITQRAESRLASGRSVADFRLPEAVKPLGEMRFSATLESGARITFEVTAGQGHGHTRGGSVAFRAINISYASDVELTEAEQEALEEFSAGLSRFARDFARNGSPDVSLLNLTDSPLLESIKLRMKTQTADGRPASVALSYQSDDDGRQLDMRWNSRSLSVSVDSGSALFGESSAGALNELRQTITDSLEKARASRSDKNVLIQALSLFNAAPNESSVGPSVPDGGEALLTGLPDYDIQFNGAVTVPMEHNEHFEKYSGVRNFEISQSTEFKRQNGNRVWDQTQLMSMDAAYFTALPHLERPDFEYENFDWTVIRERHEVTTSQAWEGNDIQSAHLWRSSESSKTTETWSEGELVDRVKDEANRQQLDDLTEWIKALSRQDSDSSRKADELPFGITHYWLR